MLLVTENNTHLTAHSFVGQKLGWGGVGGVSWILYSESNKPQIKVLAMPHLPEDPKKEPASSSFRLLAESIFLQQ